MALLAGARARRLELSVKRHLGNPWGVENGVEDRGVMEAGNMLGVLCCQQTREEAVRKMGLGG